MLSYWRKRRSGTKTFNVVFVDGTSSSLQLESRGTGNELIRKALESQRILSNQDIFGLTTLTEGYRKWLNLNKPLKKQLAGRSPYTVHLNVWVYPRDHNTLLQSTTRHQLYLQVKQDLLRGRLRISNNSVSSSIVGLIVQREIGDFEGHCCGEGYVQELSILPAMSGSLERSVSSKHRSNRGLSQRHSEEGVLTLVQGEFFYGTHSYTVQDSLSRRSTLQLMVCPVGIRVSESLSNTVTYEWEMIERVVPRGKQLYIDLQNQATNIKSLQPVGPTQFTCPSNSFCSQLSYWCNFLIEYHCTVQQSSNRSRLRRFFSARRSIRRRPEQRRLSSGVEVVERSSFGNQSSRPSYEKSTPPQHEPNPGLVVYGSSGLASGELHSVLKDDHTTGPSPIPEVEIEEKSIDLLRTPVELSARPPSYPSQKDIIVSTSEMLNKPSPEMISHESFQKPNTNAVNIINLSNGQSKSYDLSHNGSSPTQKSHSSYQATDSSYSKSLLFSSSSLLPNNDSISTACAQLSEQQRHSSPIRNNHVNPYTSPERIRCPDSHGLSNSPKGASNFYPNSHHSTSQSINPSPRSIQSHHQSLGSQRRLKESFQFSHDSTQRSCDSPNRNPNSPRRSHDSPRRSHNSAQKSHESLQSSHDTPHKLRGSQSASSDGYKHYELGPQKRSSRESSPLIEGGRYPRGGSLTRNVVPDYPLEEDSVLMNRRQDTASRDSKRVIDPAAKPKNRSRLSLPDTENYYESQGKRGSRLSMSSRRARNTSIASATYLSQPLDNGHWGGSSKLGSIASLEAQASLAELSQADSFVDPHMRSFVFMASQPDTATEL